MAGPSRAGRRPSLTRILRELEVRRLITRKTAKNDRRKSLIAISPKGQALIEHTATRTLDILDGYAQRFGRARIDALMDELRAFTRAIEEPVSDSKAGGTGDTSEHSTDAIKRA